MIRMVMMLVTIMMNTQMMMLMTTDLVWATGRASRGQVFPVLDCNGRHHHHHHHHCHHHHHHHHLDNPDDDHLHLAETKTIMTCRRAVLSPHSCRFLSETEIIAFLRRVIWKYQEQRGWCLTDLDIGHHGNLVEPTWQVVSDFNCKKNCCNSFICDTLHRHHVMLMMRVMMMIKSRRTMMMMMMMMMMMPSPLTLCPGNLLKVTFWV